MGKTAAKITLNPSQDIPFDRLILSEANVRRTRPGESIGELADDIARRGLLQSLNVRPNLDGEGQPTGLFEVPAGGRRYRALELLVKQKRLAKDSPVPCIVKAADCGILAEDDSLAENARREDAHPLDQFRAMQAMAEKGEAIEDIAAHFFVTPAVVRQRLKLASVSPIRLESVQNANDQANVVAKGICGGEAPYHAIPWFWSNQYDLKLQTAGLSTGHDRAVLRGDPATRSFSVVYLKAGKVIAIDYVNATRDYVQGRMIVTAGFQATPRSTC